MERDTSLYDLAEYPPARGGRALHEDVTIRSLDRCAELAEQGDPLARMALRTALKPPAWPPVAVPDGAGGAKLIRFRRYEEGACQS